MLETPLRILAFGFVVLTAVPVAFAQAPVRAGQQKAPVSGTGTSASTNPIAAAGACAAGFKPKFSISTIGASLAAISPKASVPIFASLCLQMAQQNNNQNQVIFSWTIGLDEDNHQVMTLQTPTGVALAPGIELKLAKGIKTIAYTSCETGHCLATSAVDAGLVRELSAWRRSRRLFIRRTAGRSRSIFP